MKTHIDTKLVKHIAQLANIPILAAEEKRLAQDFSETISVIDKLQQVNVKGVPLTHQVTGFTNVTREDKVEKNRMFTQQEALANASKTHEGYFLVERVIDAK